MCNRKHNNNNKKKQKNNMLYNAKHDLLKLEVLQVYKNDL